MTVEDPVERQLEHTARISDTEREPLTADLPASGGHVEQALLERDRADLTAWLAEWRYWLGGAVIMTAIWGVNSLRSGQLEAFWPLVPLGIWAAVLLAVAIWPRDQPPPRT
ncbi:MAG TPA: hypothetical protein VGO80_08940 [Solirubrobacteraceae bacterium]|jgi:hypothetical protein|nr:hypothetical protein [Solirubrobacteraceae bacterium]